MSLSKFTSDLIDPKLEIFTGQQSVQYYALKDYVEKHKKSRKK